MCPDREVRQEWCRRPNPEGGEGRGRGTGIRAGLKKPGVAQAGAPHAGWSRNRPRLAIDAGDTAGSNRDLSRTTATIVRNARLAHDLHSLR
jgi:hypothetical protein